MIKAALIGVLMGLLIFAAFACVAIEFMDFAGFGERKGQDG